MKETLFIILIAAWVLEWFVYVDAARKRREGIGKTLLLNILISISFVFCIFIGFLLRSSVEEPMELTQYMGIIFLSQGLLIRYWTYYLTKPYFSRTIVPLENRPLFSNGPFRFTRHPFHTGFFLNALGVCLFISGHWVTIITSFLFLGSALHYRMTLEENMFYKKYGDIYVYWCKHRFRLVPFIY